MGEGAVLGTKPLTCGIGCHLQAASELGDGRTPGWCQRISRWCGKSSSLPHESGSVPEPLGAFVKDIAFLISFRNCLLSVYKNATCFCMLILYPATSLNSLVLTACDHGRTQALTLWFGAVGSRKAWGTRTFEHLNTECFRSIDAKTCHPGTPSVTCLLPGGRMVADPRCSSRSPEGGHRGSPHPQPCPARGAYTQRPAEGA